MKNLGININSKNSIVLGTEVYITMLKAQKISKDAKLNLDFKSTVNHPKLGKLVKYNA